MTRRAPRASGLVLFVAAHVSCMAKDFRVVEDDPPPSIGLYAWGESYAVATHREEYPYVLVGTQDVDAATSLPGKVLVEMLAQRITCPVEPLPPPASGVPCKDAMDKGWLLKDAGGALLTSKTGTRLADVGHPDYQKAWLDNVSAYLTEKNLDGVLCNEIDGVFYYSDTPPALYPNHDAFRKAMLSFVRGALEPLKSRGFYVLVNAYDFEEGGGPLAPITTKWWRDVAPSVSGLMYAYWLQGAAPTFELSAIGPDSSDQWDEWQSLVGVAQGLGRDFFGLTFAAKGADYQPGRYARGSMLLDWNGAGGAIFFRPDGDSNPWDATWTRRVGKPLGAKERREGAWTRLFSAGTVYVNPTRQAVTVDDQTIPALDAVIPTIDNPSP